MVTCYKDFEDRLYKFAINESISYAVLLKIFTYILFEFMMLDILSHSRIFFKSQLSVHTHKHKNLSVINNY